MEYRAIKFKIDSQLPNVALVGAAVCGIAKLAGFDPLETYHLELCVVEAVTNSIEHGYEGRPGSEVEIDLHFYPDKLRIIVRDHGKPMELQAQESQAQESQVQESQVQESQVQPAAASTVDLSAQDLPLRGRGLAIIRELLDEVTFEGGEQGNTVTMVKEPLP